VIGMLRGRVVQRQPPWLLLEVNGVGYELEAPMSTFYALPADESQITLFTHLAVREDAHILYGFAREADRGLFRALLKVSGVGGKMALAILSGMTADEFARCVQAGDTAALTRLPGIGKRTAERLIVEMRDRLEPAAAGVAATAAVTGVPHTADGDAVSALIALGYKANEASRMVREANRPGMDTEAIIRAALQASAKA
jgi:Holliday junction DNA helicase RuvA